jgi:hypothetical protein
MTSPSAIHKAPSSPPTQQRDPSRAAEVSSKALSRMPVASSSAASLKGAATTRFNFIEKLTTANHLADKGQYDEARSVFAEIDEQLKATKQKKDSLIPVNYYLGLAYTYPAGSKERKDNAAQAYTALNFVCAYNKHWKTASEVKRSAYFCALRSCYEELKPLVPETETEAHEDIETKLAECSPYILRLHAFDAIVNLADRCIRQNDLANAAKLYNEALQFIQHQKGTEFLFPRADCRLSYIGICDDPIKKKMLSLQAKEAVFQLYDAKEDLCTGDPSKKTTIINQLIGCLEDLAKLFPDESTIHYHDIQARIAECKKELTASSHRPPKGDERLSHRSWAAPSSRLLTTVPGATGSYGAPGAEPDYLIPRASCLLDFVKICDESEKEVLSLRAKTAVFEIYSSREALCAVNSPKMTGLLEGLMDLFEELSQLFPKGSAEHLETMQGIEKIINLLENIDPPSQLPPKGRELTGKSSSDGASGPSDTAPGGKPPKNVTLGPAGGGSWTIGRIFAALALAAVAVTVGVVFYRRNIVQIN